MVSPMKKLDFDPADKENRPYDESTVVATTPEYIHETHYKSPVVEAKKAVESAPKPSATRSTKELEAEEPLLQENPNRFVLFPIKYHEVRDSDASLTHKVVSFPPLLLQSSNRVADLADVQEG